MYKKWLPVLFWLVAIGLLALLVRSVGITAVLQSLGQLQMWQIFILILLNGVVILLVTMRWWLILWGMGWRLPLGMLTGHRLAAFGVSYFTPGPHFGGEPVQVLLVEKVHGVPRRTAVSAVALDKTLELLTNFAFVVFGVLLLLRWGLFGQTDGRSVVLFFVMLLLFPLLYLLGIWRGKRPLSNLLRILKPVWRFRLAWAAAYERMVDALADSEAQATLFCRQAPHFFMAALLVSLLGWLFLLIEFVLMLTFLGADLSLLEGMLVLTAVRIAYLLPLPGGIGSVEAAMIVMLNLLGQNPALALSASVLIRSRDVLLSVLGLWWGSRFLSNPLRKQT